MRKAYDPNIVWKKEREAARSIKIDFDKKPNFKCVNCNTDMNVTMVYQSKVCTNCNHDHTLAELYNWKKEVL